MPYELLLQAMEACSRSSIRAGAKLGDILFFFASKVIYL